MICSPVVHPSIPFSAAMPPRAKAAAAAAADAPTATAAADGAVVSGKRKRTTVAEVDAAAAAKAAAAEASSKPKRARAEPKPKVAAAVSASSRRRAAPVAAAAAAAAAPAAGAAAPRDRYPDKSIPALLGCAPTLRAFCLSYPDSFEDFPWKHRVFKVGSSGAGGGAAAAAGGGAGRSGKIFAYLSGDAGVSVGLGVKLPTSGPALVKSEGFAEEMGYGMGKHGWVNLTFNEDPERNGGPVSIQQAKAWIDESFRAIANKTQSKQINVDLS